MKQKLLILFAFLLIGISSKVQAYSFSSVCSTGQTLYYNIKTANTVEVTYELSHSPFYITEPTGVLVIPNSVIHGGITYSVTSIGGNVFDGCTSLTTITIPNSVTTIGANAFRSCSGLTSITIPNSVTTIGSNAFSNTPYYNNMPDGVVYVNNVLYKYKGTMPAGTTINIQTGTISISNEAFYSRTGLTTITIPNSVTSIGINAFCYCSGLTSVIIPNSVTSIGDGAFGGCTGLTTIIIPNSVTSIGNNAFSGTPYYDNKPDGVVYINNVLHKYKGIMPVGTTINIQTGTISISNQAFFNCTGLTTIIIPNSVTSIGNNTFDRCTGLTTITIPNSVTSIGGYAFYACTGLTKVSISNSVTSIGEYSFSNCTGLTSITIPNSVTSIGNNAFQNCTGLTTIKSNTINPPFIYVYTFAGINNSTPLYVPCVSVSKYQSAVYWNTFTNIIGSYDTTYYDTVCKGELYNKYGFNFNTDTAGLYTLHLQTLIGCDSIINLELTLVNPPTQDINMVTVDNNNHNVVVWDKNEIVNHYNIYREGVVMGQFDLIATVPYDSLGIYVDTNSNPTVKAYMYKVSTTDTCMNESELSTSHKTMHLTIGQGMGNNWNLNWTPYEGANYSTYNIYRGINSLDSLKYLTTISASNTSYTDINVPSGYVYYQVEILKDITTSNKSNGINSIRSNYATNKVVSLTEISNNYDKTKLYPNPTNNKAILEIEGINGVTEIIIYDLFGRVVENCKFAPKQKQLEINVEGFAKGVYNIKISNKNYSFTKKLIVE